MSLLKSLFNENDKDKKEAGQEKTSASQKVSEDKVNFPKKAFPSQEVEGTNKQRENGKSEDFSIQKFFEEFSLSKNQPSTFEPVTQTGEQIKNLEKKPTCNAESSSKSAVSGALPNLRKPSFNYLESYNSEVDYDRSAFSSFFTVTNRRLTIILLEDSKAMSAEKDKVKQIVNSVDKTDLLCIIKYGKVVKESGILEAKTFNAENILYCETTSDDVCIFDALVALESVVDKNYMKIKEISYKREKVNKIDVIGIGRALDNCSLTTKVQAIDGFTKISKLPDVTTKYYCLTEENFLDAATIGFRSIGAFMRKFL